MENWINIAPKIWVSNLGNYKIEAREIPLSWGGVWKIKEKTVLTEAGRYYQFTVDGTRYSLHRLVALAFPEICGEYKDGLEVDHIIPVKLGGGNEATNLRWVTRKENLNNPNRSGKLSEEEKQKRCRKRAYEYFLEHKDEINKKRKLNYVKGSRNEYLKEWRRKHKNV